MRYLDPFVNLADPGKLAERLVEIFEKWDVTLDEAREAVRLGFEEDAQVKADIAAEGAGRWSTWPTTAPRASCSRGGRTTWTRR